MLSHTDALTHSSFYTEELLHREVLSQRNFILTHRPVCTQKLLHMDACTLYTQKLLHIGLTHRCFYALKLLHTHKLLDKEVFTQRSFYTQKLLHGEVFTQRSLYAHTQGSFTHRSFYPQKLLHTEAFIQTSFCTKKPWHREVFTQGSFYTQRSVYTENPCHRGPLWRCKTAFLLTVFAVRLSFRAKRLHLRFQNCNFSSVLDVRPSFRARWLCIWSLLHQFFDISVWRGEIAILHPFCCSTPVHAKGLRMNLQNPCASEIAYRYFVERPKHQSWDLSREGCCSRGSRCAQPRDISLSTCFWRETIEDKKI